MHIDQTTQTLTEESDILKQKLEEKRQNGEDTTELMFLIEEIDQLLSCK